MNRPRKLSPDAIAQELGDRIGGTHETKKLQERAGDRQVSPVERSLALGRNFHSKKSTAPEGRARPADWLQSEIRVNAATIWQRCVEMPDHRPRLGSQMKAWGPAICLTSGMAGIGCALSRLDGSFKVIGWMIMAVGIVATGYLVARGRLVPGR